MNNLSISRIKIHNFRSIVDTSIDLGFETVVVGKNNIGKSSLVEIFDVIQRPHLTDFNIDMLRDIWRHRTDPENISKQSVLRLTVTFDWNTVDIEYWRYLSSLSKSGTTQLEIVYGIDSEVFDKLTTLTSIHELLPLLTARAVIGSINDIQSGTGRDVSMSFQHFLPRSQNIDNMSPDGYLLYNIKAFRQVDSFKEGNQTATAAQLSDELKAVLSDQQSILDEIQASVDKNLTPKLSGLKEDLSRFAYPKRDAEELSVILTIDEWLQKPQVRIAETYSDLKGFELGIPQQGLGYQNIYNIVARINRVFAELKKRDLNVPVLIVIEEPEAFTHPQLQHVFLQQITEYIHEKSDEANVATQLLIISHSAEIASAALDQRFNLVVGRKQSNRTFFLNWDKIGGSEPVGSGSRDKLKKLVLNFNAELLFADKLLVYEGNGERLILNALIRKVRKQIDSALSQKLQGELDKLKQAEPKLEEQELLLKQAKLRRKFRMRKDVLSETIAMIPAGTAFANYFPAIAALEFDQVVLITDIDFQKDMVESKISDALSTNGNIKFLMPDVKQRVGQKGDIYDLLAPKADKLMKRWHVTADYEFYEVDGEHLANFEVVSQGLIVDDSYRFWPRTLESAMIFATAVNEHLFHDHKMLRDQFINHIFTEGPESFFKYNAVEENVMAPRLKKADFALSSLDVILDDKFTVPAYLREAISWLVSEHEE